MAGERLSTLVGGRPFAIRKLNRPLPCIIEHIQAQPAEMTKAKAWVEKQLRQDSKPL